MNKRRRLTRLLLVLSALILMLGAPALATAQDVPQVMTHQGRLFSLDNVALSGPQTLTFRAYDAADDTGAELWSETVDVTLANGYYSVVLGQTSAIPGSVFDGSTRYLGVTVGDATVVDELTPRLEITSVAYALKSSVAENATGALTPESVTLNGGGTVLANDGSVTVGGAQISPDGQISLGAATVNTDGSIVVGNTTINPDGSISVGGSPVIASDGGISADSLSVSVGAGLAGDGSPADPLVTTDVTLTGLEGAGCTDDQVPQFNAVSGWACQTVAGVDTDTTYTSGNGLTLTGPANTFSVDFGIAQQRVSGACAAGSAIQAINVDGSVTCETDDDTQYAAGTGIDITAGTISLVDTVDDDTTYTAGSGLTLTGTTFDVDAAAIQARVAGTCLAGSAIRAINADGSVSCEADSDTQYTAGAGIDISGGAISLLDPSDDDTTYGAGTGLTIDGANDFHVDYTAVQQRISDTCAVGQMITAINADGTVQCADPSYLDGVARFGTASAAIDCTLPTHIGYVHWDGASFMGCTPNGWARLGGGPPGLTEDNPGRSCLNILTLDNTAADGVYWIDPDQDSIAVQVYCDMTTDGGGWTLVSHAYNATTSTSPSNQAHHSLKCGGGGYSPTNRGGTSGAIDASDLVKISTEIGFSMFTGGGTTSTGTMEGYDLAYKFTIPDPSVVHFNNHSYLGPNWDTSGAGPASSTGPCVPVTVTGIHGTSASVTKYTLQNVLGTSWTDTYPTGYGVADNTNCHNHDGGPFFTSVHTGHGHSTNPGSVVSCDVTQGRLDYTHRGSYTHNSTGNTGSTAIWLR